MTNICWGPINIALCTQSFSRSRMTHLPHEIYERKKTSWKNAHHFICFRRDYMTWWFGSLWPFDKISLQPACSGTYKDGLNFENNFSFYCSVGSFYFFFFLFLIIIIIIFYFTILYWFYHTSTCIHHGCTCIQYLNHLNN